MPILSFIGLSNLLCSIFHNSQTLFGDAIFKHNKISASFDNLEMVVFFRHISIAIVSVWHSCYS